MKQFTIVMRERTVKASVKLSIIPIRIYISVKNALELFSGRISSTLKKFVKTRANHSVLSVNISGGGVAVKNVSILIDNILTHNINSSLKKYSGAETSALNMSNSSIEKAYLTKYRTLGDMDADGNAYYVLSEFDNITLEDLYFIIL